MDSYNINTNDLYKMMQSLKTGELKFHQFYNLELSPDESAFQNFMINYKESDPVKKTLNKSYYDIEVHYDPEVFPDSVKVDYPVNSIAVYNNLLNKAIIYCTPNQSNITEASELKKGVQELYNELIKENPVYEVPGMELEVKTFLSDKELLEAFFLETRNNNPLFLIGFNSSIFDDPYVVNRGYRLSGDKIYRYISEFNEVRKYSDSGYDWPDYILIDLLKLYKPVDQGGNGLGSSLPNYKLGTVAMKELGITKLDLEDMNYEYINNIIRFLTYNLLDTILTFKIDEKLEFMEQVWMLTKYNNSPMSAAVSGRSRMYSYRNNLIYTKQNKITRVKKFNREIFYPLLD